MTPFFSKKPVGSVTWADLLQLVETQTSESLVLDFKREFPSQDKFTEFAKDVLGMANAAGGCLVYGILDGGASAGKLQSLGARGDVQREVERQMQLLLKHAAPKVYGVRYEIVESHLGECAVVVRVPASSLAPHAVRIATEPETFVYYLRTAESHIRAMPEEEIRRRYVAGSDLAGRVERIRMAAYHGVGPPLISPDANKWVQVKCCFIPVGRHELGAAFSIEQLRSAVAKLHFKNGFPGQHPMPIMQGLFIGRDSTSGLGQFWLAQRDGSFVWIDTSTNVLSAMSTNLPPKPLFPRYEDELRSSLGGLVAAFHELEITSPIAVCLSLSNSLGASVPHELRHRHGGNSCLHEEVHAPAILIDNPILITPDSIKPAFDVVMNAFGIEKSVAHLTF
jgi:hypothetical protein